MSDLYLNSLYILAIYLLQQKIKCILLINWPNLYAYIRVNKTEVLFEDLLQDNHLGILFLVIVNILGLLFLSEPDSAVLLWQFHITCYLCYLWFSERDANKTCKLMYLAFYSKIMICSSPLFITTANL